MVVGVARGQGQGAHACVAAIVVDGDAQRLAMAERAIEGDVGSLEGVVVVGEIDRGGTPSVAGSGDVLEGDIGGCVQADAGATGAQAIGGDVLDQGAVDAVEVDLGSKGALDRHVLDGDAVEGVRADAGIRLGLDAVVVVRGHARLRPEQGEVLQYRVVAGEQDAVAVHARGVDGDPGFALAQEDDALVDVEGRGQGVGAVGDEDGFTRDGRVDGGLQG